MLRRGRRKEVPFAERGGSCNVLLDTAVFEVEIELFMLHDQQQHVIYQNDVLKLICTRVWASYRGCDRVCVPAVQSFGEDFPRNDEFNQVYTYPNLQYFQQFPIKNGHSMEKIEVVSFGHANQSLPLQSKLVFAALAHV